MKVILNRFLMVTSALFSFFFFSSLAMAEPQRVVALAPSLAEMIFELKQDTHEIVGVTDYSDEPSSLKEKPSVGPYFKVNLEKTISLHPTLIVGTEDGNDKNQIQRLKELGQTVLILKSGQLSDISDGYRRLGASLNETNRAAGISQEFEKKLKLFGDRGGLHRARKRIRIAIQVGDNPLVFVGGRGFLSEAIGLAGVENIFGDLPQAYPRVSREEVLLRKPDMIVFLTMSSLKREVDDVMDGWTRIGFRNVKSMKGDRIVRPTIRLFEGLELFSKVVYEEK